MGTATTHSGPKTREWAAAKGQATRWAKAGGAANGPGAGRVVAAAAAALAAGGGLLGTTGPAAGQRLARLLSGLATDGLEPTLRATGLGHLVGLTGTDLLVVLIDYVAGDDAGLEAAAVRAATDAVIAEVVEHLEGGDNALDEARVQQLLELFWSRYIAGLVLQALDKSITDAAPGSAEQLRQEIRDTVQALLQHHLDGRSVLTIDWTAEEGARIMDEIRTTAIYVVRGDTDAGQ